MSSVRVMFEKTGSAVFISHLDLVRTMQRVFLRAGIKVRHTEGFNPHPKMVFPLPLSVGVSSVCEILDTELEEDMPFDGIAPAMNATMPDGLKVLEAWAPVKKSKEIGWLDVRCSLEYDSGVPDGAVGAIEELFSRQSIVIERKTKSGINPADIAPMIHSLRTENAGENRIDLRAVISAQNPTLNPTGLLTAITTYLPELSPDFADFSRQGIYDRNLNTFR